MNRKLDHTAELNGAQPAKPSLGHILVVDDDEIVLAMTQERLETLGYRVTVRAKALGTAAWVKKHRPLVVFLDIGMPALSGTELANLLQRPDINVPHIFHSGKDKAELERLVQQSGALGGLHKGLDDKQFAAELARLLRGLQARSRR